MTKKILIFGGSGFIGSSLTNKLIKNNEEICIICQDGKKASEKFGDHANLTIKNIDIFDEAKIKAEISQYDVIINLIGKLFEAKKDDFKKFHQDFPKILAKSLNKEQKLIHISALGIEKSAQSSIYAKTKLAGEENIIKNCQNYNIIKPSIVFGENDNFFNLFAKMSKISPFLPLIGGGKAKFSPIYVEDLVDAIVTLINDDKNQNKIFEAFGPQTSSFKELMSFILNVSKRKRILLNLPFSLAKIQGRIMNLLKLYLITPDQVELLKYDNVSSDNFDNIDALISELKTYEKIVPKYLP